MGKVMITSGIEQFARVLVYRVQEATGEEFPLTEDGKLAEYAIGSGKIVKTLYRWSVFDDVKSVLNQEESDQFTSLLFQSFSPSVPEAERTPEILLEKVVKLRSTLTGIRWTQVEYQNQFVPLAHSYLNQLELIGMTFMGLGDVFVVLL